MYLLNPIKDPTSLVYVEFTFHYVSIKSLSFATYGLYISKFTFHYVSIKSAPPELKMLAKIIFTFHYVSIKSTQQVQGIRAYI